jgi:hypothetical protein
MVWLLKEFIPDLEISVSDDIDGKKNQIVTIKGIGYSPTV